MAKIIRTSTTTVVILDNGVTMQTVLNDERYSELLSLTTEEEIIKFLCPEIKKQERERDSVLDLLNRVKESNIFTVENGNLVYWKEISSLSVPQDLVEAVLNAIEEEDEDKFIALKNFWTLMSLNPNEECRQNLYWFLKKWGIKIAKCGFFVAYRNVEKTREEGVFTDNYTHTFKIKIGEMVCIPREQCNSDSSISCSRGLHLGGKGWLRQYYCGDVGLVCLCNPAQVVAVPKIDDYGKLRTCEYLPIDFAKFDSNGNVIPYGEKDGFDCQYITKVIYEGLMGTETDSPYRIIIPDVPGTTKESITNNLLDIAKQCIVERQICQ